MGQVDLAFLRNSRQLEDAITHGSTFVDYAALSNNRCVSDQLGALGLKRIHFHSIQRLNAGIEHALHEQLTFFSNASIVVADVDTQVELSSPRKIADNRT